MEEYQINDIADNLLILNKYTIDTLCSLPNAADCLALYVFYYKTAKWQKTNTIKANDEYILKCLKWGTKRMRETKQTLKEQGLIDIVQRRSEGKIDGWYVKVSYLVSQKEQEQLKIAVESKNAQKQQVAKATSGFQETNALKEYIKCLKKEIEVLKGEKGKIENNNSWKENFDRFYKSYPRKVGKANVEKWFSKNKPNDELFKLIMSKLDMFKKSPDWLKQNGQFIPYPTTWLNQKRWEDEIGIDQKTFIQDTQDYTIFETRDMTDDEYAKMLAEYRKNKGSE